MGSESLPKHAQEAPIIPQHLVSYPALKLYNETSIFASGG